MTDDELRFSSGAVLEGAGQMDRRAHDLVLAVLLAAITAALRLPAFGASTLWHDDAWRALSVRAESLTELLDLGVTAPGFGLLVGVWLKLFGTTGADGQSLALVFGVAGPPALYLTARRLGSGRRAAVVGATVLITSPMHLTYSLRLKQYSLEVLLMLALVVAAWRVIEQIEAPRRWWQLAGTGIASLVMSAAVAPAIAASVAVPWLTLLRARRRPSVRVVIPSVALAGFTLLWALLLVRPRISPTLQDFWAGSYIDTSSPVRAVTSLIDRLDGLFAGLGSGPPVLIGITFLVLTLIAVRADWRRGLLIVTPVAAAALLAALELAPLGERTDTYLLPVLALGITFGLDLLLRRAPVRGVVATASTVITCLLLVLTAPAPRYPPEDIRPLVAMLEDARFGDDVVLVYPNAIWGYALHTRADIRIIGGAETGTGFDVEIDDDDVAVLGRHRRHPGRYEAEIEAALRDRTVAWLIASHISPDLRRIRTDIEEQGFELRATVATRGAEMDLWTRRRT